MANRQTDAAQSQKKSLHPVSTLLVALGGGVVGYDYGKGIGFDPFIGAIVGLIISAVLVNILRDIYQEREQIRNNLAIMGAIVGAVFGFFCIASGINDMTESFIIAAACSAFGGWFGYMAATLIVYAAFLLLFLSQGPVGFVLRSIILNSN
ncbi:hypothetical protein [Desulfobacter curvatus]|uniref:hypothetical protein n=1 Tax=Desulfobacter curvatus TaxID=2290 RepID=UPI00035E720D|nr:hypothetical protein [Desulfobacter curvatus]